MKFLTTIYIYKANEVETETKLETETMPEYSLILNVLSILPGSSATIPQYVEEVTLISAKNVYSSQIIVSLAWPLDKMVWW